MYDPTGHLPGAVPSRVLTALRGETKRLDAPVSIPAFSLSPAERAQDRAEACLTDLTAALLSRGSDAAAHAQRMAVATHAAAQALLSAYVLWLAQAEAGGLSVPVVPLAPPEPEPARHRAGSGDTILAFIADCLKLDTASTVRLHDAYDAYMAWCVARGRPARTRYAFAAVLARCGFHSVPVESHGVIARRLLNVRLIADTAERDA